MQQDAEWTAYTSENFDDIVDNGVVLSGYIGFRSDWGNSRN